MGEGEYRSQQCRSVLANKSIVFIKKKRVARDSLFKETKNAEAMMAAVSERRFNLPKETALKPHSFASLISSSVQPPSGPMKRAIVGSFKVSKICFLELGSAITPARQKNAASKLFP